MRSPGNDCYTVPEVGFPSGSRVAREKSADIVINLDSKLFSGLVNAVQGKKYMVHQRRIVTECQEGAGREAIKVLDDIYDFNKQRISDESSGSIYDATCKGMEDMGQFLADAAFHLEDMGANGENMADSFFISMFERKLRPYDKDGVVEVASQFSSFENPRSMNELLTSWYSCYRGGLRSGLASKRERRRAGPDSKLRRNAHIAA